MKSVCYLVILGLLVGGLGGCSSCHTWSCFQPEANWFGKPWAFWHCKLHGIEICDCECLECSTWVTCAEVASPPPRVLEVEPSAVPRPLPKPLPKPGPVTSSTPPTTIEEIVFPPKPLLGPVSVPASPSAGPGPALTPTEAAPPRESVVVTPASYPTGASQGLSPEFRAVARTGPPTPVKIEIFAMQNPVELGQESDYLVRVTNAAQGPAAGLRLLVECSEQLRALQPTSVPEFGLEAGAARIFRLKMRADAAGPGQLRVQVETGAMPPVSANESISILARKAR